MGGCCSTAGDSTSFQRETLKSILSENIRTLKALIYQALEQENPAFAVQLIDLRLLVKERLLTLDGTNCTQSDSYQESENSGIGFNIMHTQASLAKTFLETEFQESFSGKLTKPDEYLSELAEDSGLLLTYLTLSKKVKACQSSTNKVQRLANALRQGAPQAPAEARFLQQVSPYIFVPITTSHER